MPTQPSPLPAERIARLAAVALRVPAVACVRSEGPRVLAAHGVDPVAAASGEAFYARALAR